MVKLKPSVGVPNAFQFLQHRIAMVFLPPSGQVVSHLSALFVVLFCAVFFYSAKVLVTQLLNYAR